MAETKIINDQAVATDELLPLERAGELFMVPQGCLDCPVLTTKRSAEARGLTVVKRSLGLGSVAVEQYFPQSQEAKIKIELENRIEHAVSGACQFIVQQACWRVESE